MSDAALRTAPPASSATAKAPPRIAPRTLLVVGGALLLAAAGAWWIASPKATAATDDAYVQADSTTVAPKVRGLVAAVLVRDNQQVHAGDPLVRIDPEEFDARVAAGAADLADANAAVLAANAALTSLAADERLAGSNIRAARTAIAAADAQSVSATADRGRFEALAQSGAVTASEVDQHRASAVSARSDAERSRALLNVNEDQAGVVKARRAGLLAARARAQAAVTRAEAQLDLARQDQSHTLIVAPIDGVVGARQVQTGDYVQPGARLLTLVPLHALYVTANFKETQVARMRAGQSATIKIDALGGAAITGQVESFAPGSGSSFALLPFEPGTGNFTKVVQRVPVKLKFVGDQARLAALRPGLSATVTVRLSPAEGRTPAEAGLPPARKA